MSSRGESLRTIPPPRSRELTARVVAKHAAWWGSAVYIVFYLFLAMTVGSALVGAGLESCTGRRSGPDPMALSNWIVPEAIAIVLATPLLVRFVVRRRRRLRALAENGVVTVAYITSVGSTLPIDWLLQRRRPSGVVIWVTLGSVSYRAIVAGFPAWAQPGVPIGVVTVSGVPYALLLMPDDQDFLARESSL